MWSYAATEWLRLTLPNIEDQTRSRWPIHPLWDYLSSVDWQTDENPLLPRFSPARIPNNEMIFRGALSSFISFMARDEWQWIDSIPKISLLPGEVERDRWLTREEADQLIEAAPDHLVALIRFALATGCRAREITGLEVEPR